MIQVGDTGVNTLSEPVSLVPRPEVRSWSQRCVRSSSIPQCLPSRLQMEDANLYPYKDQNSTAERQKGGCGLKYDAIRKNGFRGSLRRRKSRLRSVTQLVG